MSDVAEGAGEKKSRKTAPIGGITKAPRRTAAKSSISRVQNSLLDSTAEEGCVGKTAISEAGAKKRFILFVGNLSFETTKADLEDFFQAADALPQSIRFMTERVTGKPRGFAFVEYSDSMTLSRALGCHHNMLHGRRINVELTAGGGGSKSMDRKRRIHDKNQKLSAERQAAKDSARERLEDATAKTASKEAREQPKSKKKHLKPIFHQ